MAEPLYEHQEPRTGLIAAFGIGTIIVVVAMALGVQSYFDHVEEQQVFQKQLVPVSDDLKNIRARVDGQLHSYQYLDRNAGLVRIPIERGMELLAKEAAEGRLKYPSKPTPVVVKLQGAPEQGGANAPPPAAPAK